MTFCTALITRVNSYSVFQSTSSTMSFIYIISYDSSIYNNMLLYSCVLIIASYFSMLFVPLLLFFVMFPLVNSYQISNTSHQPEYLFTSLLLFIFLEVLLFVAYFWYFLANYSYAFHPNNFHILLSSNLYVISGLILSLLSMYLSIALLGVFILMTSLEFSNSLDILYINDNPLTTVQLTIVFLHLMHLVVGILFILLEIPYPTYYHFIEVIWLALGYCIYLN